MSAPEHYEYVTDGPVRCVEIATSDGAIGFLWAAMQDQAAGFEPCRSAGDDGMNASVSWFGELRRLRSEGLDALQAFDHLTSGHGLGRWGRAVPTSLSVVAGLRVLSERAARPSREPAVDVRTHPDPLP